MSFFLEAASSLGLQPGAWLWMWEEPSVSTPRGVVVDFLGMLGHWEKEKILLTLGGLNTVGHFSTLFNLLGIKGKRVCDVLVS